MASRKILPVILWKNPKGRAQNHNVNVIIRKSQMFSSEVCVWGGGGNWDMVRHHPLKQNLVQLQGCLSTKGVFILSVRRPRAASPLGYLLFNSFLSVLQLSGLPSLQNPHFIPALGTFIVKSLLRMLTSSVYPCSCGQGQSEGIILGCACIS